MGASKAIYRAHSFNSFNPWLIHFLKESINLCDFDVSLRGRRE
jgi:hypothetical protein